MFGLPNDEELKGMMGFVTDEDRQKWEQMEQARQQRKQNRPNAANELAKPGLGLAERAIGTQMQAAQHKSMRDGEEWVEETTTRSRKRPASEFDSEQASSQGYEPEFG